MKKSLILIALFGALFGCGSSEEPATAEKELKGTVVGTEKKDDGGEAAAHAQREANLKANGGTVTPGDGDKEMSGL